MSTVPILQLSMQQMVVLRGRRFYVSHKVAAGLLCRAYTFLQTKYFYWQYRRAYWIMWLAKEMSNVKV